MQLKYTLFQKESDYKSIIVKSHYFWASEEENGVI